MSYNPNNPCRSDHPEGKLVDGLMYNPWDDFEAHSSQVVSVRPRDMGSLLCPPGLWPVWMKYKAGLWKEIDKAVVKEMVRKEDRALKDRK